MAGSGHGHGHDGHSNHADHPEKGDVHVPPHDSHHSDHGDSHGGPHNPKLAKYGFHEEEVQDDALSGAKFPTGYPRPSVSKRLIVEDQGASIEETYYWILNNLRNQAVVQKIDKIIDSYSASEHSSMWGAAMQKISLQQQNAAQYMRGVSEMLKALFQLVREVRDLDMRLIYYDNSKKWEQDRQLAEASEITLKGLWVDLVEGGSKSPASVYGMSQQLGFTILPDLFFRTNPRKMEDIKPIVDAMQWNPKVREVLERKLMQYHVWKNHSERELRNRREWTLKYLRQHYNTIKLYVQWVKPYLRYARKLALSEKFDKSPDLVKTFETNLSEIELMTTHPVGKVHAVMLINFLYRTKPAMEYSREFQHRGPVHTGEISLTIRGYVWDDEQVNNYKKLREDEDLELIADYDRSIVEAMETLGDDLKNYLKSAGEKMPEKKDPSLHHKKKSFLESLPILEPFIAVGKGFGELLFPLIPERQKDAHKGPSSQDLWKKGKDIKKAEEQIRASVWNIYRNYKKSHGMLTW